MRKYWPIPILILLLVLSVAPALAQRVSMTVTPIWRPGEQLTTRVDLSDYRYVDVQLQLSGNVQFWAMNMTCIFTPTVLEGYTYDPGGAVTPSDPGDDVEMMTWGPDWGTESTDFVPVSTSGNGFDFDPATGRFTLTATRLGNVTPLGVNGAMYNMLLGTIRLRVRDLGTTLVRQNATIRCTPIEFLDRDGRSVARGTQARTPALPVRTGYEIRGQVLLQAARIHTGIEVTCTDAATSTPRTVYTDRIGRYTFGNSDVIRNFGEYECVFSSPLNSPQAEFLDSSIELDLNAATYYLLPVTLKGGNVSVGSGSENEVDLADLTAMTAAWSPGVVALPYDGLDVDGNRKVDRADLAILAGNYAPGAAGDADNPIDASHMLFGLATDRNGDFPNSRIFWGDLQAGPVQQLIPARRERDFWPAMSPDGETVAFTRVTTVRNVTTYTLYTSATERARALRLTPARGFDLASFAPSWSPDGQRIAFICSDAETGVSGFEFNEGDVCVIDANGANFQVIATNSKIYPPAWMNDNVVIYAGQDDHPTEACRDTLCFVDLANNITGEVAAALLGDSNDVADMPAISSFDDGGSDQTILFYRFHDGSTNMIQAIEASYNGSAFVLGASATAATPSGGNAIDYYDVSPFMDLVYYESTIVSTLAGNVFLTTDILYNRAFQGSLGAGWGASVDHRVDGFVGNPTITAGFNAGQPWSGDPGEATLMHALRATMQWIP